MSILLDSLRKSEAQRQYRDAPTIHSAQEYGGAGRGQSHWIAPVMILLAAAAIAWFGWRQFEVPPGGSPEPQPSVADRAAASGESTAADGRRLADSQSASPADDSRTPLERLSPADDGESPANRVAAYAAEIDGDGGEDLAGEEFEAEDGSESFAYAEEEYSEDGESLDEGSTDEFADVRPPERVPPGREVPGENEPRSYWQLPSSWRSEMPEFKISVLVYAEAAEDRFLLINGERLKEGEELEGGVTLEEIRRDGAVFSYRQTRFLVKS